MWKTSCLTPLRSHECERGTQECVRHVNFHRVKLHSIPPDEFAVEAYVER